VSSSSLRRRGRIAADPIVAANVLPDLLFDEAARVRGVQFFESNAHVYVFLAGRKTWQTHIRPAVFLRIERIGEDG